MASTVNPPRGSKRRRDSGEEEGDIGEGARARVKTEPEANHHNGSMELIMDGDLVDPPTPPVPRTTAEETDGDDRRAQVPTAILKEGTAPEPLQPGPSVPSYSGAMSQAPPFIKVERGQSEEDKSTLKTIPLHKQKIKARDSDESTDDEDEGQELEYQNPQRISRYFKERSTVYTRYDFGSRAVDSTPLAVHKKRTIILNAIEKGRVVIIEGFTGCGKTTQIPQFILDQCAEQGKYCKIAVTQPRKIAAISVAKRVCHERKWSLGSVVGYQVGMENRTDQNNTLLTFMTTGVLLQKLISTKMSSFAEFTHVIIDEVHERDLESDFLLLVIKQILAADSQNKGSHVKLILMSATIDAKKFADYFVFEASDGELVRPQVIKLSLTLSHQIQEFYLNDLLKTNTDLLGRIGRNLNPSKAAIQEELYDVAVRCILRLDELERAKSKGRRGAVLVFLPGKEEIRRLQRALDNAKQEKAAAPENVRRDPNFYRWVILPLHSSVPSEEQARVFEHLGDKYRKIILSTNVAESSVTVPDISYVIDFCVAKSLCVDPSTNFTTLRMVWASKSQCIQRRGRTGRVADGIVYRLLPRNFYMELPHEIQPEMQRSNLETIILMCKKFDMESPKSLLSDALDPPNLDGIERAVATLKELGALTVEVVDKQSGAGRYDTCDGDLTFLGKVMSDLPISPQCTRLIMLGHIFGVMREAIIIAAGLSVKSPFHTGFQRQLDTYLQKMNHSKKSFSDLFVLLHVYKFWIRSRTCADRARLDYLEYQWARGAFVNLAVLREIKSTVSLLEERLERLGITDIGDSSSPRTPPTTPSDSDELTQTQAILLKLAIAGAFYPHYFRSVEPDVEVYRRRNERDVNRLDVLRTVYFTGFPSGHSGKLYAKHVADYLSIGSSTPTVGFEGGKVFASFDNSNGETIGPFNRGMFRALKLSQLGESCKFTVLRRTDDESRELRKADHIVNRRRCTACPPLTHLPPIFTPGVWVKIRHIVSPSQFWVVIDQHDDFKNLSDIKDSISADLLNIPLPSSKVAPNAFCLAPFQDSFYYRAKILRVQVQTEKCLVYLVDCGNTYWVPTSSLQDFSPAMVHKRVSTIACLAVECRLSNIKPNTTHGLHWSEEAITFMRTFCRCRVGPRLRFQIFSIHQSIMSGELIILNEYNHPISLNASLKSRTESGKQFGEDAVESSPSKENHRLRDRARVISFESNAIAAAGRQQIGDPVDLDYIEPPENGRIPVTLRGPSSPLEMDFVALVRSSSTKKVRIETSSVNSVMLHHDPTTPTCRMLVAADVGIADRSQNVIARNTTILPPVPGILGLVSMLFAPKVELRTDTGRSKYTGILCGCGAIPRNPDNAPVYPDNDMEIVFDTKIDDEDIDRINCIRYHMNLILRNNDRVNKPQWQKQVNNNMIKLLRKSRRKIDKGYPQEDYVWSIIGEEFLYTQLPPGVAFHHKDIFQPHRRVLLNEVAADEEVIEYEGAV